MLLLLLYEHAHCLTCVVLRFQYVFIDVVDHFALLLHQHPYLPHQPQVLLHCPL